MQVLIIPELESEQNSLVEFLESNSKKITLENVAFITNVCQPKSSRNVIVVAKDVNDLCEKIKSKDYLPQEITCSNNDESIPKIGFLFSGQGSQYKGMGKSLYEKFPVFQRAINFTDKIFEAEFGISLKTVIWENETYLNQTLYSQPAVFLLQYALTELWKSFGIQPAAVLGHSTGEYAAAVSAGIISLIDGFRLVTKRSKLVSKVMSGSMLAIKTSSDVVTSQIQKYQESLGFNNIADWIDIAAMNSPNETVVSGPKFSIQKFQKQLMSYGINGKELFVAHPFHSRAMDKILLEFEEVASKTIHRKSKSNCKYISALEGREINYTEFGSIYWKRHLRNSVNFIGGAKAIVKSGCDVFIDIGGTSILSGMMLGIVEEPEQFLFCPSIRKSDETSCTFYRSLSLLATQGIEIDWERYFQEVDLGEKVMLELNLPKSDKTNRKSLPTFNFDALAKAIENSGILNNNHQDTSIQDDEIVEVNTNSSEYRKVYDVIKKVVMETVRLARDTELDEKQTFKEMGIDSMMSIEIGIKIKNIYKELGLPTAIIQDYPSLTSVASFVLCKIQSKSYASAIQI